MHFIKLINLYTELQWKLLFKCKRFQLDDLYDENSVRLQSATKILRTLSGKKCGLRQVLP